MSEIDGRDNFEPGNTEDEQTGYSESGENSGSENGDFAGDTDRVNGEYHYRNGYTQKIYSDAHYVPAGESTVPPKYYTPPEKPAKEPKEKKERSQVGAFPKILCMCLVCALLGGLGGAALVGGRLNRRMDALSGSVDTLMEEEEPLVIGEGSSAGTVISGVSSTGALPASAIYAQACEEVVGIKTDVTYTNFFGMTTSAAVSGSGFIISADGYIMTNYHVIEYAYKDDLDVTVMFHDGTSSMAAIVGVESANDIAVLKVEADGLNAVTFANSDDIAVGDDVYAVGNPLGELDFTMTTGHVSALDRMITTSESAEGINMFQIDAAVNSGNSGGPVYNAKGEVIGIVTAKYSDTGVEGLGFSIPVNDATAIANDLITKGYVTGKAYLGVTIDERYDSMYSQFYGMPLGAYVSSVESGTCAEAAGLQSGDIITKLGDNEVTSYTDLKTALKRFSAGDSAEIVVYRSYNESQSARPDTQQRDGNTVYRLGEYVTLSITFDEARPS